MGMQAAAELSGRRLAQVILLGEPRAIEAQASKLNADLSAVRLKQALKAGCHRIIDSSSIVLMPRTIDCCLFACQWEIS